ncbi:MAG: hypothetical protein ACYC9S_09290 [Leptospirales bacterium]
MVWQDQLLGPKGGRPIENHEDLTVRVRPSHLTQKCFHEVGIHGVGDHPVQSSLLRAKGGIDIAELPDKGFQDRGTEGTGSPTSRRTLIRPNRASSWKRSKKGFLSLPISFSLRISGSSF